MSGLESGDFTEAEDPIALFRLWFEEAAAAEINDPEAMTLCTVDRTVFRTPGWCCARASTPTASCSTPTPKAPRDGSSPPGRRRRPSSTGSRCAGRRGSAAPVSEVSDAEADAYFSSRPRSSRVGAWASQQSRPLESRAALEAAVETYARRFGDGDIPRPAYWRGYRMTPVEIEFWSDGAFRLHDRILFRRPARGSPWRKERLYP